MIHILDNGEKIFGESGDIIDVDERYAFFENLQIYKSLEYQRLRKEKYNLLNQDEMRFDDLMNGTTTWQDAIIAIKLMYPKTGV